MLKRVLMVSALAAAALMTTVRAEESRALLTTENKFPERFQPELSYMLESHEYESDASYRSHALLTRFGLLENVTARLRIPFVQREDAFGASDDGLGDVGLGFDLLAYEDIFRYPYVIPHFDVLFPTGDEDKSLGSGEVGYSFGVSVGTVVYDVLHYVLDGTYASDYDTRTGVAEDAFIASLSIIWDVSKRFSVMGEGRVIDYQDTSDQSVMIGAGMSYAWTENLGSTIFVAGWPEAVYGEDQSFLLRVSYSF